MALVNSTLQVDGDMRDTGGVTIATERKNTIDKSNGNTVVSSSHSRSAH